MLGLAGETRAQSGAALLQVAPGATIDGTTPFGVTARTDTVMLELNTRHIYEYDFHKEKAVASVEIEVTATRLNKATGAKLEDADFGSPMLIALTAMTGVGAAASVDIDDGTATDAVNLQTMLRFTNNDRSNVTGIAALSTLLDASFDATGGGTAPPRYAISMPILTIEQKKAVGKQTIVLDMPGTIANGDPAGTGLDDRIWISGRVSGSAEDGGTVRPSYFTVLNDDGNTGIFLSVDPSSLKDQDDEAEITVTAYLNSKPAAAALTFAFKDVVGAIGLAATRATTAVDPTTNASDNGYMGSVRRR